MENKHGNVAPWEKLGPRDVGVVVGRFQVDELHEAHKQLIDHVCEQHDKVVIVLGVSPLWSTRVNPLDFEARKQMILAVYPHVTVVYVQDSHSDEVWSARLDRIVRDLTTPAQSVVIYGGRDSFIDHYFGKYDTRELEQDTWVSMSGTDVRRRISTARTRDSSDFRAGVVWSAYSRFPACYTTVDVAIMNLQREPQILLGRKEHEDLFRLIGGFVEPSSESFEQDARREVMEETGIEVGNLRYVGSFKIDDWRYRREVDKIKTLLFTAEYVFGAPNPGDDIVEVRWFKMAGLRPDHVMPPHRPLIEKILTIFPQDTDRRDEDQ